MGSTGHNPGLTLSTSPQQCILPDLQSFHSLNGFAQSDFFFFFFCKHVFRLRVQGVKENLRQAFYP